VKDRKSKKLVVVVRCSRDKAVGKQTGY
jgi:hypothetical protein